MGQTAAGRRQKPDWPGGFYQCDRPFATLLSLYRHDWDKLGLSLLFYVIKHSPEWIRPLVVANLIDIIARPQEHSLEELGLNAGVLLASIVQNIPTHYLHIRYMSEATRQMEADLRSRLTRQLQFLSIGFHKQRSTGALQAKLLRDVEEVQQLASALFQFLPSTILTILVAIGVTATRAPWFLLFFALTIPAAIGLVQVLNRPLRQRNRNFRQRFEEMSARLVEMIQLIPVTRAHGAEQTEIERIDRRLQAVKQAAIQLDGINAITNASAWVTLRLFYCFCLFLAAVLAYQGKAGITAGDVVLLTGYFETLAGSVLQILAVLPQLGTGFESLRSIGEVLECPDLEANQGKDSVCQVRGDFYFDQVGFAYVPAVAWAVQDFTLQVAAGETIAFVGPSGAGKSTLLNLIIGFLRPTQGRILLDGQDMARLDLRTYRQFLAVVSQDTILLEGTIRENVLYGIEHVTEADLEQALRDAHALEFITQLPQGMDTPIGENGTKLSGGQRQRLAIARALIRNPKVLVLDEATASLDSASERLIQSALERLMAHRTTFVVAHRLSTIRRADRIVVMEAGRIAEIGTHPQLLAHKGLYAQLHSLQSI